ncbi:MAG: cob(I)yrinic acid a,c-diamide adenosyltransferase [Chloroflexi bacterium]|nr:cob(I)yrinic acid a,c-diamide adenosyltransferase [Chloroflexota bacterium]
MPRLYTPVGGLLGKKLSEFKPSSQPFERGLVQIFTGDGKGKTTAALGTVLRAAGQGLRVFIVFFMKGDYPYGEFATLPTLPNVTVAKYGLTSFCNPHKVKQEEKEQAKLALDAAREAVMSGKYDLVVMDEVNVATSWNLIEVEDVVKLVEEKPQKVELIFTGRYAPDKLVELADLVTEVRKVKHPFDKGIKARKGIEY